MRNLSESIILNEKIPMDLASALKRSFSTAPTYFNDEDTTDKAIRTKGPMINYDYYRSNPIVDYETAEYEVISSDECLEYLGLRINPSRSIEGKARASRIYNKNEFDIRLRRIIIILNGYAFRFQSDVKEKDYIVMVIGKNLDIPESRFIEKGLVSDYNINHFMNTFSYYSTEPNKNNAVYSYIDLAILIKLADKIYKSNESENLIKDKAEYIDRHIKNKTTSEISLYKKSDPRSADPTIIDHYPYSRLIGNIEYRTKKWNVSDTGKHISIDSPRNDSYNYDMTNQPTEYIQTTIDKANGSTVGSLINHIQTKKRIIDSLNTYKGYKKYIEKLFNQDKLDEEQFNKYIAEYNIKIEVIEQDLKDIVNDIYKLKAHLTKNLNREAANIRSRLYELAKNLEQADSRINALKDNLHNIQNTSILNKISSEINYDSVKNDLHNKQEELNKLITDTNSNQLTDDEIVKKLDDINSLKTDLNSKLYDYNFNEFTQKIIDNTNKLNELSSLLSNRDKLRAREIQKYKKGITYKDEAEFNKQFEKEYAARENIELAPELQNIINFN